MTGRARRGRKVLMIVGIIIAILVAVAGVALFLYVDNNRNGEARDIDRAYAAGFQEKQVELEFSVMPSVASASTVSDGGASDAEEQGDGDQRGGASTSTSTTPITATVNYAEGPNNGPALILVHGQSMEWEDYARVLPDLAKNYHVFAIDCFGHGESAHDPVLYTCVAQGAAIVEFARQYVGESYLVSGLSSGGIIAAWVAANDSENVSGCLLEDPPLFHVTPQEMQQEPGCFVWEDAFRVTHDFLQQDEVDDLAVYYAQHSYLFSLFGGLQPKIAEWTAEERAANPDAHLVISWVPHDWVRGMYYYDDFDPLFSETFYTGAWFEGMDQAETLSAIQCSTVYLKANTRYGDDGLLYAANTDEDAARVQELVANCQTIHIDSGHDIHYEHPDAFVNALDQVA